MPMLQTILIALLSLSVFSGCAPKECTPIKEYVYINRVVPPPLEKPKGDDFQLVYTKFNGIPYYVLDEREAQIMSANWISYKHWAETNYGLLKAESKK